MCLVRAGPAVFAMGPVRVSKREEARRPGRWFPFTSLRSLRWAQGCQLPCISPLSRISPEASPSPLSYPLPSPLLPSALVPTASIFCFRSPVASLCHLPQARGAALKNTAIIHSRSAEDCDQRPRGWELRKK